jgi:hypothetical protein
VKELLTGLWRLPGYLDGVELRIRNWLGETLRFAENTHTIIQMRLTNPLIPLHFT